MKCDYCGRELKTESGYRSHIEKEAFDYTKRLGFWDEYREVQEKHGYAGTPNEYAWGRVSGLLGLDGKPRW